MLDLEVLLMLYTVEEIRGKLTPIFEEKGAIRALAENIVLKMVTTFRLTILIIFILMIR